MANTRTRAPLTLPPLSPPSAPTRTTSVRRNLFHTQLSRRPPAARTGDPVRSRTVSTATSSASTLVLGGGEWGFGGGDIVVRDGNGEFEVGDPGAVILEEEGEEGGEESKLHCQGGGGGR